MIELTSLNIGTIRWSKNSVPHLLVEKDSVIHSITFFRKTKTYRVFWPWPSYEKQSKRDFKTKEEVIEFLR